MKAAQLLTYEGQDAVQVRADVSKPTIQPNEVLVEVYAAGINPFDVKVRDGLMRQYITLDIPATLGGDVAGMVAEVGSDVKEFRIGQAVFGSANAAGGQGSFAEFVAVNREQLANKPDKASFIESGALPLVATSAYQALVEHMQLQPGQRILIHGGAGGIGSMAIQIAKHLGAHVITTSSVSDIEFVAKLGADEVIDYKQQDFAEVVQDVDAVFDTIGGETNTKSYDVLKSGGVLVSMVEPPNETKVAGKQLRYIQQQSRATTMRLQAVAKLVDDGVLKVHIDQTFPLDNTAEALEYVKTSHSKGKVVIEVKTDK